MGIFDGMSDIFMGTLSDGTATITPKGATLGRTAPVIWIPIHVEVRAVNGIPVETTSQAVHLLAADAAGVTQGARIAYGSATYEVDAVKPNNRGMVCCVLKRPRV